MLSIPYVIEIKEILSQQFIYFNMYPFESGVLHAVHAHLRTLTWHTVCSVLYHVIICKTCPPERRAACWCINIWERMSVTIICSTWPAYGIWYFGSTVHSYNLRVLRYVCGFRPTLVHDTYLTQLCRMAYSIDWELIFYLHRRRHWRVTLSERQIWHTYAQVMMKAMLFFSHGVPYP